MRGWVVAEMPEITEVQRIALNPGDVVVARVAGRLTAKQAHMVSQQLRKAFPSNEVLVLDGSAELDVFRPEESK